MSSITILQMPAFKRAYKKLHPNQKKAVNQAITESTRTLHALGVHENFYRDLKR